MRAALNILAEVAPEWLRSFAPDEWYERDAHRVEEYRLPKEPAKRTALVETIGADGYALLDAIYTIPDLNWLQHIAASNPAPWRLSMVSWLIPGSERHPARDSSDDPTSPAVHTGFDAARWMGQCCSS